MSDARRRLLGGLSPRDFLARHWQKEALRIPAALPRFRGPFDLAALKRLAQRDDVESRLVIRERTAWTLRHGPLRPADFRDLPPQRWTLLVQGVNLHDHACDALLRHFAFVPYARLDDVMVSYAAPGGGVGPHLDNYDVFLLQGFGRRRWRYGRQQDASFRPGLPLRILERFAPTADHVFASGDLLYLPPQWAHDGVAVEACTTYSIGFRAATVQELATAFLDFLRDEIDLPGRYADPGLAPTATPARIPPSMRRQVAKLLQGLRWDEATVGRFLGRTLSEPKPIVVFDPPAAPLSAAAFHKRIGAKGVHLDPRTQMLYDDVSLHVNGTSHRLTVADAPLRLLADARALAAATCRTLEAGCVARLHEWYCDGYLAPGN
jgi:50S ribosomal protein L16 3-hydroxylase